MKEVENMVEKMGTAVSYQNLVLMVGILLVVVGILMTDFVWRKIKDHKKNQFEKMFGIVWDKVHNYFSKLDEIWGFDKEDVEQLKIKAEIWKSATLEFYRWTKKYQTCLDDKHQKDFYASFFDYMICLVFKKMGETAVGYFNDTDALVLFKMILDEDDDTFSSHSVNIYVSKVKNELHDCLVQLYTFYK